MQNTKDFRVTLKAGSYGVVAAKGIADSPRFSSPGDLAHWLQAKGLSLLAGFRIGKESV